MKPKLATLFIIILHLSAHAATAQWQRLFRENLVNHTSVFFVDAEMGVSVGESSILKTVDGGKSWAAYELQTSTIESLTSVFFTSEQVGFVAGKSIYKTTNGGVSWDSIYTTHKNQSIEAVQSIFFNDENRGTVVGVGRHITTNAGTSWYKPEFDDNFVSRIVRFVDDSVGYLGGWLNTGNGTVGHVSKSTNRGDSWQSLPFYGRKAEQFEINTLHFFDRKHGWIAGNRYSSSTDVSYANKRIFFTTDGGNTWDTIATVFPSTINAIVFANQYVGFIGDDQGRIYSTQNGGQDWTKEDLPNLSVGAINDIVIIDSSIVYAVGDGGKIYKRDLLTSVEKSENAPERIRIFPNPSEGEVSVVIGSLTDGQVAEFLVMDTMGRGVYSSSTMTNEVHLDLKHLVKGPYFLCARTGVSTRTIKFILN